MKTKLLIFMLIFLSTLLFSQSVIWEETFDPTPNDWTLEDNWSIMDGMLMLSWTPTIEPYDLSAISPVISLPEGVYECIATQYFENYSAVDEMGEIIIIHDGIEEILWAWDFTQGNWGVPGGEDIAFSIADYGSEDVQFKFRSYGSSTFNFNYWYIYNLAITASLEHDLCAFSIDGPISCSTNQEETWTVTVKNSGLNIENNYTVKLMKEGEVELGSIDITTPISIGEELAYDFNWIPTTDEFTYLYGEIELIGDEFPDNDTTPELAVHVYPEGAIHALVWDNDNNSYVENPDFTTYLGCEEFLEMALDDNNIVYDTVIFLPPDLSAYDVVLVTLGVYCVG